MMAQFVFLMRSVRVGLDLIIDDGWVGVIEMHELFGVNLTVS